LTGPVQLILIFWNVEPPALKACAPVPVKFNVPAPLNTPLPRIKSPARFTTEDPSVNVPFVSVKFPGIVSVPDRVTLVPAVVTVISWNVEPVQLKGCAPPPLNVNSPVLVKAPPERIKLPARLTSSNPATNVPD